MPSMKNPYPTGCEDQIITPARASRSVEALAREFEPYAEATAADGLRGEPSPPSVRGRWRATSPASRPDRASSTRPLAIGLGPMAPRSLDPRCPVAPHRRSVDGPRSRSAARQRRGEPGDRPATASARHPPGRPGVPTHVRVVRPALHGGRHPPVDGLGRRRLRRPPSRKIASQPPAGRCMCERPFATLECAPPARRRLLTEAEARMAIPELVESRCDPPRRHSALGHEPHRVRKERAETAAIRHRHDRPRSREWSDFGFAEPRTRVGVA